MTVVADDWLGRCGAQPATYSDAAISGSCHHHALPRRVVILSEARI
jgi:hypothetical protein